MKARTKPESLDIYIKGGILHPLEVSLRGHFAPYRVSLRGHFAPSEGAFCTLILKLISKAATP